MSGVLPYLSLAVLAMATFLVYVWYGTDVSRRKGLGVEGGSISHPLEMLSAAVHALWREQTLLFLLFIMWVSGAMGTWVKTFWSLPGQMREDRRFGIFFFEPWAALKAMRAWTGVDAALQSLPRQTLPFASGHEATLVPAVLILIVLAVALFVGVTPAGKKTRTSLYVMLGLGFVSVLLWMAIPYIASAAQSAQQHPPAWFAALLMIATLLIQAPLAALLGSFSLAALYQMLARGGWSWKQTASRAAVAFLPFVWMQLAVFVSLNVLGTVASSLMPAPQAAEQMQTIVMVQRVFSIITYAAAVLLLFFGWAAVVEGASWTAAIKRDLSLIRRHFGAVATFALRAAALVVPVSLLSLLLDPVFEASLAGRFVNATLTGLVNTALLLMVGTAYLRLRETDAAQTAGTPAQEPVAEGAAKAADAATA